MGKIIGVDAILTFDPQKLSSNIKCLYMFYFMSWLVYYSAFKNKYDI